MEEWGDAHDKALRFQTSMRDKFKMLATNDGLIRKDELTASGRKRFKKLKAAQKETERAYDREKERKAQAFAAPIRLLVQDKRVFVGSDISGALSVFEQGLRDQGMRQVFARDQANFSLSAT